MARRLGIYSLRKYGALMCRFINDYGPLIEIAYPSNTVIAGLLATAYAACKALDAELTKIQTPGV